MAVQGKCTFGTRMPLDIHMLNDIISREVKHYKPYKTYQPNFGCLPLTSKFYARHDEFVVDNHEHAMHIEDYHHHVTQSRARGPLCKYKAPHTENQVYGWYTNPLVHMDRNDPRFYSPLVESPQTKVEVEILAMNARKKMKNI